VNGSSGSPAGELGAYLLIGIVLWLTYRRRVRRIKIEAARIARAAAIMEAAEVFDGTGPLVDPDEEAS
jgi:hypothetical protein